MKEKIPDRCPSCRDGRIIASRGGLICSLCGHAIKNPKKKDWNLPEWKKKEKKRVRRWRTITRKR